MAQPNKTLPKADDPAFSIAPREVAGLRGPSRSVKAGGVNTPLAIHNLEAKENCVAIPEQHATGGQTTSPYHGRLLHLLAAKTPKTLWFMSQFATVLCLSAPSNANGFILNLQPNGSLVLNTEAKGFARHYNDGVERVAKPSQGIKLLQSNSSKPKPSKARVAPAHIQGELDAVVARYGGHNALRQSQLSVSDWARLFQSAIQVESAFKIDALSSAGAIGLGQLMPATAKDLGVDPNDWRANLDGAARYLLAMLAEFGTPELAIAAYNAGPGAVRRYAGIPPYPETKNHVLRVMALANLNQE